MSVIARWRRLSIPDVFEPQWGIDIDPIDWLRRITSSAPSEAVGIEGQDSQAFGVGRVDSFDKLPVLTFTGLEGGKTEAGAEVEQA